MRNGMRLKVRCVAPLFTVIHLSTRKKDDPVQLAASNLNLLQSLTGADGVNGDGVLVQSHDDGEHDGDGDAGKGKVPAGSGAPSNVTSDGDAAGDGDTGLRVNKLEAGATNAVGDIGSKGLSDSSPSQESNDNRDNNQNAGNNDDVAQESGTDGEDELVTESSKEVHEENDGQQGRNDQSNEGKRLGQLDHAEAGRAVNIESESVGLNLIVVDGLGGDALK